MGGSIGPHLPLIVVSSIRKLLPITVRYKETKQIVQRVLVIVGAGCAGAALCSF